MDLKPPDEAPTVVDEQSPGRPPHQDKSNRPRPSGFFGKVVNQDGQPVQGVDELAGMAPELIQKTGELVYRKYRPTADHKGEIRFADVAHRKTAVLVQH